MADYKKLKPFILKWEGGYVDDPLDKGGATNKGITLKTFQSVYGTSKTKEDLKKLTDEQWDNIFRKYYWNRYRADEIQCQSLANICVDWVWASGKWGITYVQDILGLTKDGIVGPKTINAINEYKGGYKELFDKIKQARISYVNNIVQNNPSQKKFINGWMNRINSIKFCC